MNRIRTHIAHTPAVYVNRNQPLDPPHGERRWTPAEDSVIRLHYPTTAAIELAPRLGRTAGAVINRAYRIGVTKFPAVAEGIRKHKERMGAR